MSDYGQRLDQAIEGANQYRDASLANRLRMALGLRLIGREGEEVYAELMRASALYESES